MNALQHETSPYLLQHKNNPVNWFPWKDNVLQQSISEDKLLVISIGYAACHWCHVMEHESFEDTSVAQVMNQNYISIKVDREERPDIDQIYMNVAMITNGHGGWPLNIIALPGGKPIFAGTYFPKQNWIKILLYFSELYQHKKEELIEQAEKITQGIRSIEYIPLQENEQQLNRKLLDSCWNIWKNKFDYEWGGQLGAPKFMMPNNYLFLLNYFYLTKEEKVGKILKTTLKKMAFGGLHDVLAGGFARYSVDAYWKVPHFEKMLYDNGQLMSLYARAYQVTKRPLYKSICEKMLDWLNNEMADKSGGLYASLDADSEGMEGKFYCWTEPELKEILKDDFIFFKDIYNIEENGNFEHGLNILFRTKDHEYFMEKYGISNEHFQEKLEALHQLLSYKRKEKIRPATDDKILTEWNAIAAIGLCDAYKAFNDERYKNKAIQTMQFILENCKKEDNRLDRNYKNGKSSINGFLQDYAFTIEALISLYQITLEENYLIQAQHFLEYVIQHFYNEENGMFFLTSDIDSPLIARSIEVGDNVIPSGNSAMAKVLLLLGKYFDKLEYIQMSETMLNNVLDSVLKNPMYYSNWAIVLYMHLYLDKELIIIGKNTLEKSNEIQAHFLPDILISGSINAGNLPLLKDRFNEDKTLFYFCNNKTCDTPTEDIQELYKKLGISSF
ncbi:MAG: thioredoxin domain-containing protein [Chitinophagales bacterium]